MKILIAYDGSESADTGIDGLQRAGLPTQAEALVVSVAEVWLPPPPLDEAVDDTFPFQIPAGVKLARERAARLIGQAEELAGRGGARVQSIFPQWTVSHEALSGSPAFELLSRARRWQPELIVTGSHGHTALGRFVLGSVSQKVLTEAQTSVRIARRMTGAGTSAERIVVGCDGSTEARAAIRQVAARNWTPGSEVRVVVAEDLMKAFPVSLLAAPVGESVEAVNGAAHSQAEEIAAEAIKELQAGLDKRGVTVSSVIEDGDPRRVIVSHAEEFGADCIFTGATGFSNRFERFVLGSVSAAVAARAHCSVEVVRAAEEQPA